MKNNFLFEKTAAYTDRMFYKRYPQLKKLSFEKRAFLPGLGMGLFALGGGGSALRGLSSAWNTGKSFLNAAGGLNNLMYHHAVAGAGQNLAALPTAVWNRIRNSNVFGPRGGKYVAPQMPTGLVEHSFATG